MIAVELFYHCDRNGCLHHAYVEGDVIASDETTARVPQELPKGWTKNERGTVYCPEHST